MTLLITDYSHFHTLNSQPVYDLHTKHCKYQLSAPHSHEKPLIAIIFTGTRTLMTLLLNVCFSQVDFILVREVLSAPEQLCFIFSKN